MTNTSKEEDSQYNIHQQPFTGGCANATISGHPDALTTVKKRRSLPGNPDPDAEVIALSPRTLLATKRFTCEVCHKGFPRDQNLQLHRRGHNLPWKLKQKATTEVKKRVYVCPEVSCTHHNPSRALGDLTGIKKHFSRKHGEKTWKCDKCSKKYAVQSDWKAHSKICGTKEYRCDCGTIFARKDSFVTHRAFCEALAEQNYRVNHGLASMVGSLHSQAQEMLSPSMPSSNSCSNRDSVMNSSICSQNMNPLKSLSVNSFIPTSYDAVFNPSVALRSSTLQLGGINMTGFGSITGSNNDNMGTSSACMSATGLLQKAEEMGSKVSDDSILLELAHIPIRQDLSNGGIPKYLNGSSGNSTANVELNFQHISPVLFKGFKGYSTSTRSTLQEPLGDNSKTSTRGLAADNLGVFDSPGLMPETIDGNSHVSNQSAFGNNSKWVHADLNPSASVLQNGMLNSPLILRSGNRNPGGMQGRRVQKEVGRGNGRMTQDFLGLGPMGHQNTGDQSYHESTMSLRYLEGEQDVVHDVRSYHQISQDQTALEKPMWEF